MQEFLKPPTRAGEKQMHSTAIRTVGLSCLLVLSNADACRSAEDSAPPSPDALKIELQNLGSKYKQLEEEWLRKIPADGGEESDEQLSDQEWIRKGLKEESENPGPDDQLLPSFLAFAKANPDSPLALDALAFVIRRGGSQTGDVLGKPWQLKEAAIDMVAEQHMDDPRVAHIFDMLTGSLPSHKTEAFLRQKFANPDDRAKQACAELSLARYLNHFRLAHSRSQYLQHKAKPLNYERFWKLVVTPYLEQEFPCDAEKVSAEVEHILTHVVDEYADVPATDWGLSGPGKVLLHSKPYEPPATYGELAKTMLFELNNLVPGKQAPEIDGVDADGKRFQLSDYRGKVVLLTFSADWCGGCVELYPLQRNLIDKYRDEPFALLSVSRDEQVDTLKSSLASGVITWRCWWDGMHGPIHRAWNSPGAPKLYLLDRDGVIQDARLNRYTPQADFERAIAQLLNAEPAK